MTDFDSQKEENVTFAASGHAPSNPNSKGLFSSIRQLAATLLGITHTRISLLGIELSEEKDYLIKLLVLVLGAAIFALLGLILLSFFLVAFFWETHRWQTVLGLGGFYMLGSLFFVWRAKGFFSHRPPLFEATLAELEKDRQVLQNFREQ